MKQRWDVFIVIEAELAALTRTEWGMQQGMVASSTWFLEIIGINPKPNPTPPPIFDFINLIKADWSSIRQQCTDTDWEPIFSLENQDEAWNLFSTTVGDICARHAPYKGPSRKNQKPRIPRDRIILIRKKRKLLSRLAASKFKKVDPERILSLHEQVGELELKMGESIKDEERRAETKAIQKMKTKPKVFFSYLNRKKPASRIGPLRKSSGELTSDPLAMADLLQDQYVTVFSSPSTDTGSVSVPPTVNHLNEVTITETKILEAIAEMPSSAAPGPDKFPCIILKECATQLAPVLCKLWKAAFDTGQTAEIFKHQTIVPIFKKGNRGLASNYRPVSLTSHLCKLFERVVRKDMVSFLEDEGSFSNNQHGFRAGRSCLTQLVDHLDDLLKDLENGHNVDVLYLDMSKAFDKVCHTRLLEKLARAGIGGKLLAWLESFLVGRSQAVVVDGVKSRVAAVKSGVPQGTVLAPLLFLLYVDDMANVLKHSTMKLFADDAKVKKSIETEEDRLLLLDDMGRINQWAIDNSMELNAQKYQLLQHGRNELLKMPYSLPDGTTVERENAVKDLGIVLDSELSWKPHITHVIKSASQTAGRILRSFETREQDPMLVLMKTFIRPHLEYISPIWSPHLIGEIQRVEAVQRAFTAHISGCEEMTYWQRLHHLGLYSLQRRRERYKVLYLWKLYHGLLPNHLNLVFKPSARRGPYVERPLGKAKLKSVNSKIFNSCSSTAVSLFNAVPKVVKEQLTLEGAKRELDKFLSKIPDEPPLKGYGAQNTNSILDWCSCRGALFTAES